MRKPASGLMLGALLLILAVGLVVLVRGNRQDDRLRFELEADYRREFGRLVENLREAEVWLGKARIGTDTRLWTVHLLRFGTHMEAAQSSLAQLPLHSVNLSASRKFLAQASDYAQSLAIASPEGPRQLTEEQAGKLADFEAEIRSYLSGLAEIERDQFDEAWFWTSRVRSGKDGHRARARPDPLFDRLDSLEQDMSRLPSLVYDGPFSDRIDPPRPLGIEGARIDREEAAASADRFMRAAGALPEGNAARVSPVAGDMAVYAVNFRGEHGETLAADVSQRGGKVVWYLSDRDPGLPRIGQEQAWQAAEGFLKKIGFLNMVRGHSVRQENSRVLSFIGLQQGTLIYPDLVKVQVALDNGEVIGWDATSYYMAHRQRKISEPDMTRRQSMLRWEQSGYTVKDVRLALIPSLGGMQEILCWELDLRHDQLNYLVYVNARDGRTERILQLIHDEGGVLAQ